MEFTIQKRKTNRMSTAQTIRTHNTKDKMIAEAGRQQMKELNTIGGMMEVDLKTAYTYRALTAGLITTRVTKLFFCQLVNLCYLMGVEEFNASLVLGLVNSGFEETDIAPVLEMTVLFYKAPETSN